MNKLWQIANVCSRRANIIKKETFLRSPCTAYQSRTDDLLRERQLSWTTRRMRQFFVYFGCKDTSFS